MNSSALMDNLKQLFAECDTDNNGSLGREEFTVLCAKIGLSREAARETFDRLDIDKNNRITFNEFAAGFNQYANKQAPTGAQSTSPSNTRSSPGSPQSLSPAPADSPRATPARSPVAARRQRLGAPTSPTDQQVSARVGRKSASPLGLMSLSSAGSSGTNLVNSASRSSAGGVGQGGSSNECYTSSDNHAFDEANGGNQQNPVVVYSSDMNNDYDQGTGSGQFNSLVSNSGSFSGARNMQDLLDCVQKLQSENQILSQIFFKDKREREEYISQLGEEFDQQVREVEERANRRARDELENEKRRLREMMQAERETLQHHYQTIERMSKLIKSPNNKLEEESESINKVRSKLEDTYMENRKLKKSLLDTKTDVAMIWKEMEKLKQQYESKLSNAYERNNETKNECDHIKQQLNLMKDSNKKLQDASDVITTYITDKVEPVINVANADDDANFLSTGGMSASGSAGHSLSGSFRQGNVSQANSRRGSILSEYLNGGDQCDDSLDGRPTASNVSADVESLGSSVERVTGRRKADQNIRQSSNGESAANLDAPYSLRRPSLPRNQSHGDQKANTTAGKSDCESKTSAITKELIPADDSSGKHSISGTKTSASLRREPSALSNDDAGTKSSVKRAEQTSSSKSGLRNIGRHFFIGSRTQSESQLASEEDKKQLCENSKSSSVDNSNEPSVEPADGPSKATFNIILVGDSFVGKSSFAARFMEGSFVQGLISNCSIDFKTKAYKVDGTNYTVNLWDTAGQERFRSITASYFRKADGIILMYDVTDKRSYLNVRNWMSTISDTAAENVAVLLIGNKIDLRNKDNKERCVPVDEGFRLAREYNIVFLETSVKTGTNLIPSMGKLIRLIAKNNAPVEEDKDRIRLNDKSRTFNCMPKNC